MAGLLDSIGSALGNLVSLPGNVLNAYSQGYAQMPQEYAAQAEMRRIALENAHRIQTLLPTLSPQDQLALITNPGKLGEFYAQNAGPQNLRQGETAQYYGPNGPQVRAPLFDQMSGRTVQMGPGATQQVSGNAAPGASSATGGLIIDSRQGPTGTYSQPQEVPLTSRPSSFAPTVFPPGAMPPQGSPGQLGTIPTPAQIPEMFPGATVTSGLRSPAKNAQVGGVPNSFHMQGTPDAPGAIDLVPPTGMAMAQLAENVRQRYPQAKVLDEGNHVHAQGQPGSPGAPPGWQLGPATPQYGPRTWNPKTGQYEQVSNVSGKVEESGKSIFEPQKAKADLVAREQYTNYTSANDAFKAMTAAAALPHGGMRAYALRDTFARLINPGAVARVGTIQAIEHAQGVPANIKAYFMNLKGDGNVPDDIAQQILDVSHGFLKGHYDSARALNDSYGRDAVNAGFKAEQATAPMEDLPGNVHLMPPRKDQLIAGDIYKSPKGLVLFNGKGFLPYGR